MSNAMIITHGNSKYWVEYPDGHLCAMVNTHEEAISEARRAIANKYALTIDDRTRELADDLNASEVEFYAQEYNENFNRAQLDPADMPQESPDAVETVCPF